MNRTAPYIALQDGDHVRIHTSEYFDYQRVHCFRRAYIDCAANDSQYIVDLAETRYIDSCALGLLLSMKRYLQARNSSVRVINCNDHVQNIFQIARLDRQLDIQRAS